MEKKRIALLANERQAEIISELVDYTGLNMSALIHTALLEKHRRDLPHKHQAPKVFKEDVMAARRKAHQDALRYVVGATGYKEKYGTGLRAWTVVRVGDPNGEGHAPTKLAFRWGNITYHANARDIESVTPRDEDVPLLWADLKAFERTDVPGDLMEEDTA